MDRLCIYFILLLGVITGSKVHIYGSVLEKRVSLGDNITLYCDCKTSTGVYIVWYRNCSHENQPPLVLKTISNRLSVCNPDYKENNNPTDGWLGRLLNPFPRFHLMRNESSKSYNLVIVNITKSDEGLYYCGTEETSVVDGEEIVQKCKYTYGNDTTRVIINSSDFSHVMPPKPDVSWMMVFTPALTVLSSFLSLMLVHYIWQKTDTETQFHQEKPNTSKESRTNHDEDITRVPYRLQQTHQ